MAPKDVRLNLLQITKEPAFIKAFKARPGHSLVSLDFDGAEDVVLTEFTQDPNLLKIYGPDAVPQCGYLFLASQVPSMREDVIKIYDPDATQRTPQELDEAKKLLKPQRSTIKPAKLALNYGAWPKTICKQCKGAGYPIPLSDGQALFDTYHATFPGIETFKQNLQAEVKNNGGYFVNGSGLPMAVAPYKMKDVVNTFCQSTVANILLTYTQLLCTLRDTGKCPQWRPWLVNYYDEIDLECRTEHADELRQIMDHTLVALNKVLQGTVPITGKAIIADTLAAIKE